MQKQDRSNAVEKRWNSGSEGKLWLGWDRVHPFLRNLSLSPDYQHRLLGQTYLKRYQTGFVLYFPLLTREQMEQIVSDHFPDKLVQVVYRLGAFVLFLLANVAL